MKKAILFMSLLLAVTLAGAKVRTPLQAQQVAIDFWNGGSAAAVSGEQVRETAFSQKKRAALRGRAEVSPYYIFNVSSPDGDGFVVVSGLDELDPVIGYGTAAGDEVELPPAMRVWLDGYARQVDWLLKQPGQVEPYHNLSALSGSTRSTEREPMLAHLLWTQNAPYNKFCPAYGRTAHSLVGCVATSMSMVMTYYKYPSVGQGSHSYYWEDAEGDSVLLSVDYNVPYQWNLILDDYDAVTYTTAEADAVALLSYHCGVAADMSYTAKASAASPFDAMRGLIENFSYNPNLRVCFRDYYSAAEWADMVYGELQAGRPVMYSGSTTMSGHMFVIDGYDAEGMVHVNWGWGGQYNGYFTLALLEPMKGSQLIYDQTFTRYFTPDAMTGEGEFEFYIDSIGVLPAKVKLGERFDYVLIDMYNYSYNPFTGKFVLALFDEDMNEIEPLSQFPVDSLGFWWGWSEVGASVALPDGLKEGEYWIAAYFLPDSSSIKSYARLYRYSNNFLRVTVRGGEARLSSPANSDSYTNAELNEGSCLIATTVGGKEYLLTLEESLVLRPKSGLPNQVWRVHKQMFTSDTTRLKETAYLLKNGSNGICFKNLGTLSPVEEGTLTAHPVFINEAGTYAIRMTNDTVIDEEVMAEFYLSIDTADLAVCATKTTIPTFIWSITDAGPLSVGTVSDGDVPVLLNGVWHNPAAHHLTLFDMNGRVAATAQGNFDTAQLKPGMYVMRVGGSNRILKFKK